MIQTTFFHVAVTVKDSTAFEDFYAKYFGFKRARTIDLGEGKELVFLKDANNFYFEVFPRSSISELPLMLANSAGIIDEGYRGEIIVPIRILHPAIGSGVAENIQYPGGLLKLFDSKPISISEAAKQILAKKPKIAQMILRKRYDFEIQDVSQVDQTDRADGGFGSTG
jgi:catechol 2,3-dioxygenase-like lactoylglutathione lyase family enzyme